jgi:hypothetical protein
MHFYYSHERNLDLPEYLDDLPNNLPNPVNIVGIEQR